MIKMWMVSKIKTVLYSHPQFQLSTEAEHWQGNHQPCYICF